MEILVFVALVGHLLCCIQDALIVLCPLMQIEAQLQRRGWLVLSVTPQRAAVVLALGACFNYRIISPPTLSLTPGENEDLECIIC